MPREQHAPRPRQRCLGRGACLQTIGAVQACALMMSACSSVGAFQLPGPARGLCGQMGISRCCPMQLHRHKHRFVPGVLRATAAAGGVNEGEDDKIARAKALIQRVESARSGERRAAEQTGGGKKGGDGGVFQGSVVAVTGNFNKRRPEVEQQIKSQAATFSGTVRGGKLPTCSGATTRRCSTHRDIPVQCKSLRKPVRRVPIRMVHAACQTRPLPSYC